MKNTPKNNYCNPQNKNTIHIHTILLFLINQCFYIVTRGLFFWKKHVSVEIISQNNGWPNGVIWRSNSHSAVPKQLPCSLRQLVSQTTSCGWQSLRISFHCWQPLLTAIPAIREQASIFPLKMAFVKAGHTSIPAAMGKPLGPRNYKSCVVTQPFGTRLKLSKIKEHLAMLGVKTNEIHQKTWWKSLSRYRRLDNHKIFHLLTPWLTLPTN